MSENFKKDIFYNVDKKQLADTQIIEIIEKQAQELCELLQYNVIKTEDVIENIQKEKDKILKLFNKDYMAKSILMRNNEEEKENKNKEIARKLMKSRINKEIELQIGNEEDRQLVLDIVNNKITINELLNNNIKLVPIKNLEKEIEEREIKERE